MNERRVIQIGSGRKYDTDPKLFSKKHLDFFKDDAKKRVVEDIVERIRQNPDDFIEFDTSIPGQIGGMLYVGVTESVAERLLKEREDEIHGK